MVFTNYIRFANGRKLSRGERCLYRSFPAIYLGSYTDKRGTIHMIRVNKVRDDNDLPIVFEHIVQCSCKSDIVCLAQEEPPIEGQMKLC